VPRYEGRLELTWTNKDQCLLAHEDDSYEWLAPSDWRVAEVRLLNDVDTFGDIGRVGPPAHQRRRGGDHRGGRMRRRAGSAYRAAPPHEALARNRPRARGLDSHGFQVCTKCIGPPTRRKHKP
jgi:hypothetical protein